MQPAIMFRVFAILCLAAPAAFELIPEPGVRVLQLGETHYYVPLSTNLKELQENNFVQVELPSNVPEKFRSAVELYIPPYNNMSLGWYIHKATGNLIGFNLALDQEYLSDIVFNFPKAGYATYSVELGGETRKLWSTSIFFTSDPTAITTWDSSKTVQGDKISFLGLDGELTEIPMKISDDSIFTRQRCIDGGGLVRFYNMTSAMECTDDNLYPWYLYTNCQGEIIGYGTFCYAKYTVPKGENSYAVNWIKDVIPFSLNDYPQCMQDLANSPGISGIEMWLISNPQDFVCSC